MLWSCGCYWHLSAEFIIVMIGICHVWILLLEICWIWKREYSVEEKPSLLVLKGKILGVKSNKILIDELIAWSYVLVQNGRKIHKIECNCSHRLWYYDTMLYVILKRMVCVDYWVMHMFCLLKCLTVESSTCREVFFFFFWDFSSLSRTIW